MDIYYTTQRGDRSMNPVNLEGSGTTRQKKNEGGVCISVLGKWGEGGDLDVHCGATLEIVAAGGF